MIAFSVELQLITRFDNDLCGVCVAVQDVINVLLKNILFTNVVLSCA